MKRVLSALVLSILSISVFGMPNAAHAGDGGQIAAGAAAGFLGGMVLGGALAPRPYYGPGYYYGPGPGPTYVYDAPHCYWTRGEPVWDGYYRVWRVPSARVCQ
jgi:hypothetical protein